MKKFHVFGIGLGKTGTTTLNDVLNILGWSSVHFPNPDITRSILTQENTEFNAATDTPIAANYKELYERYPGAKFILTVRNSSEWLDSIETHQKTKGKYGHKIPWISTLRKMLYGSEHFNTELYSEAFFGHSAEVVHYFFEKAGGENFNDKLLIIDLTREDRTERQKWERICKFLNEPLPLVKFPHSNKGNYDKVDIEKPRDSAKKEAYSIQYKKRSVKELTS